MTKNNSSISSTYRYPSYNLETCISKIIEVYKKETLAPISKETVAHDLGVSGKSGSFGTVFAAMKYYGLLEEQEDKTYKINEMVVGKATAENFNAGEILKLMNNPPVYKKILCYKGFNTYNIIAIIFPNLLLMLRQLFSMLTDILQLKLAVSNNLIRLYSNFFLKLFSGLYIISNIT